MRALRKVLVILCLAVALASTAAVAEPPETSAAAGGTSIGSWVLSALDSVLGFVLPEAIGGVFDPSGGTQTLESDPPADEAGGFFDPSG